MNALFRLAFQGLVYSQIWEDPEIDMEALAIAPDSRVVAIASGGCNILSYLVADPRHVTALDLSGAHVALTRLKLAAAAHLPSWHDFYAFFGEGRDEKNLASYRRFIAPQLDQTSRRYWEGRVWGGLGRPRVGMFADAPYRHGLLGRFIGAAHLVARLHGVDMGEMLSARTLAEQRQFFDNSLAPLFDKPFVAWATSRQVLLYGLGIPPAQYRLLAGGRGMAAVLRERLERLCCGFALADNYFLWQAVARRYGPRLASPLPPYLRREHFEKIRENTQRVEVLQQNLVAYLNAQEACSVDRYVLLDTQDWMSDQQLNELWSEISRTVRPGGRVIFRTAAETSLLPGRLDANLLEQWHYHADASRAWSASDRSAIYGAFHLYELRPQS